MQSYDNSKPSKHITYLDANNFYGCAMIQYLIYVALNSSIKKKFMNLMLIQLVKLV